MPNFRTTDAVRSDLNRAARLIERAAREADRHYNPKQAGTWQRVAYQLNDTTGKLCRQLELAKERPADLRVQQFPTVSR